MKRTIKKIILVLCIAIITIFLNKFVELNSKAGKELENDSPAEAMSYYVHQHAGMNAHEIPTQHILDELEKIRTGQYPGLRKTKNVTWTEIGPDNIGGRCRSILIDPSSTSTMYVASVAGGVWKSNSSGSSWSTTTDNLGNIAFTCLAMAPGGTTSSRTIYGGTGEGYFNIDAIAGAGLYRTTNSGTSWAQIQNASAIGSNYINKIAVDQTDANYIFVGNNNGLYRSTNGGTSFSSIGFSGSQVQDLELHPTAPDTLYVAVYGSGVYKISNAKAATPVSTLIRSHTSQGRIELALSPSKPSVIYAQFASTSGEPLAIDHSGNGGTSGSWFSGTIPPHDPALSSFMNTQGWYDNTIAVNPANELTVYVAGVDAYQSADAGSTWTKMTSWRSLSAPYVHADIHEISFASSSTFYIACDGGVYGTSSSGGSWSALNSGLSVTQFYYGAQSNSGSVYIGGTQDNGTLMRASGNSWNTIQDGDGGASLISHTNSANMFSSYVFGTFYFSNNSGATWSDISPTGAGSQSSYLFIAPAEMSPSAASTIFIGGTRFYKSTNSGSHWGSNLFTVPSGFVSAIGLSVSDDTIAIGSSAGKVYRSTNSGGAWADVSPAGTTYVTNVKIAFTNANIAYCTKSGYASGGHIYRTANLGSATPTWTDVSGSLPALPVMTVIIMPNDANHVLVGTEAGVFETTDGGTTWASANSGLPPAAPVDDLRVRYDGSIVAFTHGRGAFLSSTPLPVQLTSFYAARISQGVQLAWTTTTEINNYGFNVQRTNGGEWKTISFIEGAGTSNTPRKYSFIDAQPLVATTRYRLEQIDRDGTVTYSSERTLSMIFDGKQPKILSVYPNPSNGSAQSTVQFTIPETAATNVRLIDVTGKVVFAVSTENMTEGFHEVQIPTNYLGSGIYMMMVMTASGSNTHPLYIVK